MLNVGLSTCGKVVDEKLFADYKKAGITHMEVSMGDKNQSFDYKFIKECAKKYDINLWSFHLPFCPFEELDLSKKELAKQSLCCYEELIKKGTDIGIDKFVIHPSGEPITDAERPERMKCAKESLATLSQIAKKYGGGIAVEDLPRTCLGRNSAEIKELISLDNDLMVCFDTNHLLSEPITDFIRNIGDKIITTHVSDYDFVDEKHWLPGEGQINWQELYKALLEVGYNGPWLYEISFKTPKHMLRERDLTCEDFYNNAKEIFENKGITVFGKPNL